VEELILDQMINGGYKPIQPMDLKTINSSTVFQVNGWLIKNRLILSGGNRRDVEQIGASLTSTNDVLEEVTHHLDCLQQVQMES
jgi:hypothetical protein